MRPIKYYAAIAALTLTITSNTGFNAHAQELSLSNHDMHDYASHDHASHDHSKHLSNAPVTTMGDHTHGKGDWMISYRFMHMDMSGNSSDNNSISDEEIVTTIANRFSNVAGQPNTLRVVPDEMTMDMHMFGAMYGATDWLTLMVMTHYLEKEMDHTTYQGGAGTTVLGNFTTKSQGFGDTRVGGTAQIWTQDHHNLLVNLAVSVPTGSIDESDNVLTPMNATPVLRLPYAMQLGTGTYDLHPGLTYTGLYQKWNWGAQYAAEIRLEEENREGYRWGNKHSLNLWTGYQWQDWIGTTARLKASTQSKIDGIDDQIVAPVQTADPDNYGGKTVELGLGVNLFGTTGVLNGHALGFEISGPIYQNLNGPQLESDWTATIGWKKAF